MSARPIMLLTRIWPTAERPSRGSFIRDRAAGQAGIHVVRPARPSAPNLLVYPRLLLDALRAGRDIRGVEAHVLLPTGLIGLIVARLRGVPLIVYSHGSDARAARSRGRMWRWMARRVVRGADRLLTNSTDTAGHLRALGGRPMVVAPGIDLERFGPTPRPAERRVLYLGGSDPSKGFAEAERLADTLAGPGLREVPPEAVPGLIAAHDVVLVPSQAEAFGLVAVEAIASGRWVVARDVGGLRDIVIDGVNGTLVGDGDFAGALARVPAYDPVAVSTTVQQYGLERWQQAMAAVWDELTDA